MPAARAEAMGERKATDGRLLLVVVISAIFISVLNQTFTNVVVPDIQTDYGASRAQVGWVITGYLLIFAVGIPLYGRIADLFSLRQTFCAGLLTLAAGSLVCAAAPSLPVLVAGRVLQAAGASAIPALGFAAIAKTMPAGRRGAALGLQSSSVGVGATVGPVVGGAVAGLAGWQTLFLLTLVLASVLALASARVMPDLGGEGVRQRAGEGLAAAAQRFDVPGGVALGLAAGLALFGVTQGQSAGFSSISSWGSFLIAGLAAAAFTRRIRRAPEPFVSPGLFRNREFVATAGIGFFMMFANVGCLILVPFLLSEVNGLSAAGIGLVLAPGAFVVAVLSPMAGRLSDRLGSRFLIRGGLAVILLSTLFLSTFAAGSSPAMVALSLVGQSIGFATINSPNANAAATSLTRAESGVGLGIYQMIFFLGGGFGPAFGAAFLGLRKGSENSINPLYHSGASAFSDAFLMVSAGLAVAFLASMWLARKPR
jgi:DHA2 family metal-tetracycline-proton antiporter-like MFS transporter